MAGLAGLGVDEETPEDLLRACANTNNWRAWEHFIRTFNTLIVATVSRVGRRHLEIRPDVRDDIVQEVYLKLSANQARLLRDFVPLFPDSAFGYIRIIAERVAQDYFKSKNYKRFQESSADRLDVAIPNRTDWDLLIREVDDWLRQHVSERDRRIFWLYCRQGMSAKEIAALPAFNLTVEGVESVLGRLGRLLRESFRRGECAASEGNAVKKSFLR
ncbi:MAG TPA: sigma-70 family RNA polymerase sigma factor [Bryobacteraceae bacterium]|nr:sigma-70 family RNA polymerase sigma factor [Bryobacteraceae bacterium]